MILHLTKPLDDDEASALFAIEPRIEGTCLQTIREGIGKVLMNRYKISVIIPFFNTPLNLFDRCVDSILNQTFRDFEVIIVDDGSEKKYADYIDEHFKDIDNIQIFHTSNCGVSQARNLAISKSRACNICFVDADDYAAAWMLEDLYNAKVTSNADICIAYLKTASKLNCEFFRNYETVILDRSREKDKNFLNEIILRGLNTKEDAWGYLSCGPCSILVDLEIAKKVKFPSNIKYMEDVIWNYKVFSLASRVVKLNETLYAYYENNASATRMFHKNIIDERLMALLVMSRELKFDDEALQWYALRVLCNFSMIYYQSAHFAPHTLSNLKDNLSRAYDVTYDTQWKEVLSYKNIKAWESKYKFKFLLYKARVLPVISVVKEFAKIKKYSNEQRT